MLILNYLVSFEMSMNSLLDSVTSALTSVANRVRGAGEIKCQGSIVDSVQAANWASESNLGCAKGILAEEARTE